MNSKNPKNEPRIKVVIEPIYVNLETAAAILDLSESTVESLERDPASQFPKKRQISGRRTGYLLREIRQWGEDRPVSNLPPPPNTGAKKPRPTKESQETQGEQIAA